MLELELEGVVVELELVGVELDVVDVELELEVVVECADPPDALEEPEEPVVEMTGVPVGRDPLEEGTVTTTVPLPVLTTGEPGSLDPEPPEPVDPGVVGVDGVGVDTVGVVTVVAPLPEPLVPELPLPEPLVPEPLVPDPLVPEPDLVGVEPCAGARPATGWEMVAELECCAERWAAVPWLA